MKRIIDYDPDKIDVSSKNAAKQFIRHARRMVAEARKEFGFERVARGMLETETIVENRDRWASIAEWHKRLTVEKLQTAVSYYRLAEHYASTSRLRKFAAVKRKKHEAELKNVKQGTLFYAEKERRSASFLKTFLSNLSALFTALRKVGTTKTILATLAIITSIILTSVIVSFAKESEGASSLEVRGGCARQLPKQLITFAGVETGSDCEVAAVGPLNLYPGAGSSQPGVYGPPKVTVRV